MRMCNLGQTNIQIAPLVLGGNVFGWTADRKTSFAILDTFLEAGFNAIDTADFYSRFVPGLAGGESEALIGEWMEDRGVRDQIVIITKFGLPMGEGMQGLGPDYMKRACEASLKRLRTDYVDVFMAHRADPDTPVASTLAGFQSLIDSGKIGHAACSNFSAAELAEALATTGPGLARYAVFEPRYNLAERQEYEGAVEDLCSSNHIGVITFYALAAGFLTGKYRKAEDLSGRAREGSAGALLTPANLALLGRMEEVAARHGATLAQIALAWIMARPSVAAPIASATSVPQLREILAAVNLSLDASDLAALEG